MAISDLQDDPFGLQAGTPAPATDPVFPGECKISLASAAVTAAYAQNASLAIDDDVTTFAQFVAVNNTLSLGSTLSVWSDTGVVLRPGQGLRVTASGSVMWSPITSPVGPSGQGSSVADANYAATGQPAYSLVLLFRPDAAGAPAPAPNPFGTPNSGGASQPITHTVAPGDSAQYTASQIATIVGSLSYPVRIWAIFNDNHYEDNAGSLSVMLQVLSGTGAVVPPLRFLRVDWGSDKFLSRVRIALGGAGAANGAIAFESSLGLIETGDETDVPIPHLPLFVGAAQGDAEVYEITLDVPALARGLVFYPDYLLSADQIAAGSFPEVDLYHLQAYTPCQQRSLSMSTTLPTIQRARVGVQAVTLYPYNSVAGPYDNTTACSLYGLDSLDTTIKVKTAQVVGGETVFDIDSFETAREIVIKIMSAEMDVRSFAVLFGGRLVVDLADGNGGEVQYWSPNLSDRAPYVRLAAVSSNGVGADTMLWPKTKIDSSFGYKLEKDKATIWDLDLRALIDKTYVCQDGTVGGIFDLLFSNDKVSGLHS